MIRAMAVPRGRPIRQRPSCGRHRGRGLDEGNGPNCQKSKYQYGQFGEKPAIVAMGHQLITPHLVSTLNHEIIFEKLDSKIECDAYHDSSMATERSIFVPNVHEQHRGDDEEKPENRYQQCYPAKSLGAGGEELAAIWPDDRHTGC